MITVEADDHLAKVRPVAAAIPCPVCQRSDGLKIVRWFFTDETSRVIGRVIECQCNTRFFTHEAVSKVRVPNAVAQIILKDPATRIRTDLLGLMYRVDANVGVSYAREKNVGWWIGRSAHGKIASIKIGPADDPGAQLSALSFEQALASPKLRDLATKVSNRFKELQAIYDAMRAAGKDPEEWGVPLRNELDDDWD